MWYLSATFLALAFMNLILGLSGNSARAFSSGGGGSVTPEPSTLSLLLVTGTLFWWTREPGAKVSPDNRLTSL